MRRSWATRGGALAYGVLLLIGYAIVDDRYTGVVPGWVITVGFVVLFIGGGVALQGWDRRRWGRMACSLGFEPLEEAATDEGFTPRAYRGRMRGRTVTIDFKDRPRSLVTDETLVTTPHHARATPRLVVQRVGAGGTGGGNLPPAVGLAAPDFEAVFRAHSRDSAFARSVLSLAVRDAIERADQIAELVVADGSVTAAYPGRLLDAAVAERYAIVVCKAAEEVEATSGVGRGR